MTRSGFQQLKYYLTPILISKTNSNEETWNQRAEARSLMCLATFGQIKKIYEKNGVATGEIDFNGAIREICLSYLPDARIGDYITAHENLAIRKLNEKEAKETFEILGSACGHH